MKQPNAERSNSLRGVIDAELQQMKCPTACIKTEDPDSAKTSQGREEENEGNQSHCKEMLQKGLHVVQSDHPVRNESRKLGRFSFFLVLGRRRYKPK
mmetsp:Transcript_36220/g.87691  ORF Transcript_36220/g.87691 Transcript_36220/m.87691 type:complete len:97 (+) Transcript_36220:395-685(+)